MLLRNDDAVAPWLAIARAGLSDAIDEVASPASTHFRQRRFAQDSVGTAVAATVILVGFRFILAAWLPLSFDEAYYWLWSKHLALGYFDHPAAIALAVRAGTLVLGNTELGVRFFPLLSSVLASWAVWRSAAILLQSEQIGATACVLFNATLMVAAESMGATPDSLSIAASALLLWTVARLEQTNDGRWWLAIGAAAGLAIASKYTGFFLCISLVLWMLSNGACRPAARVLTFATRWPYMGALIALLLFAPTLYWNLTHQLISFRFQFGRTAVRREQLLYMLDLLGSQVALGSPFILTLAGIGLCQNALFGKVPRPLSFASAVMWPPMLYFLFHALHDRVQGNWLCFVYPAATVLAAQMFVAASRGGLVSVAARQSRALALPVAGTILCVAYAQAFFGVLPIGRRDPIARMTAVGLEPVVWNISVRATSMGNEAIVTTNYAMASWLSFYKRTQLPVIQIGDDRRFLSSPLANAKQLQGTLLYVTQAPERELAEVYGHFSVIAYSGKIVRSRNGNLIDAFYLYKLAGFRGPPVGRMP